ncbi:hypothetical protein ACHAWF_000405, partial [Thalassiosira exigua]
ASRTTSTLILLATKILSSPPLIQALPSFALAGSSSIQCAPSSGQAVLRLKCPSRQRKWSTSLSPCPFETSSQPRNSSLKSAPRTSQYFALNPTFTARSSRTT